MTPRALSPWADAARAGLAVLHPPASRIRWTLVVLNYQLFADDTGTHGGAKFRGVAGYLATEEQWAAFAREWSEALPRDLRGGKFRFTKFLHDVRVGWRDADQLLPLVEAIRRNVKCGFERLVVMEDWDALPFQYRSLLKSPYSFSLFMLLQDALDVLGNLEELDPPERLATMAEIQPGQQPRTIALWNFWTKHLLHLDHRVETVAFRRGCDYPQLQAADLFAHTAYQFWLNGAPQAQHQATVLEPGEAIPLEVYRILEPLLTGDAPQHDSGLVKAEGFIANYPRFDAMIRRRDEIDDLDDDAA